MIRFVSGLALAVVVASIPRVATAQACGPYRDCLGTPEHRVECPVGVGVYNCHFSCAECIFGECHPTCTISKLPGVDGEDSRRYAQLLRLADDMDVAGLVAGARDLPGRVFYSPQRDAVQVVGCDGISIAASIPLLSAKHRLLASERLPDASEIGPFAPTSWRLVARLSASRDDLFR